MARTCNLDDLIDAVGVAELLGLSRRNAVSTYAGRYPTFPPAVLDLGKGRPKLWLRPEITQWAAERAPRTKASDRR